MLKSVDPELFQEYLEVQVAVGSIGKGWQIRDDGPFGYGADLDGTHIEKHTDKSDYKGVLASINASGIFTSLL